MANNRSVRERLGAARLLQAPVGGGVALEGASTDALRDGYRDVLTSTAIDT